MSEITHAKPFLRWAGGKIWLTKYLDNIIGNHTFNGYHEPFLGGASVFFHLMPKENVFLSDLNEELINTYIAVKQAPNEVIYYMKNYTNDKDAYYEVREKKPSNSIEAAARFIYLNQTSFNGIYRVNKKGVYNVPYGYRNKNFIEEDKILTASKLLQTVNLYVGDFDNVENHIKKGDLVFLDPPYTVSHNQNGFIKYNQKLFSLEDQFRLKKLIDYIKEVEAYYILTNAAHETIYNIFYSERDRFIELNRANLIGGEKAQRGQIQEYVFTNIEGA